MTYQLQFQFRQASGITEGMNIEDATDWVVDFLSRCPTGSVAVVARWQS